MSIPPTLLFAFSCLLLAAAVPAQPQWSPLGDAPRTIRLPVFDTARGRVVAFGEDYLSVDSRIHTFEWNGRWQPHQLATPSGLGALEGAVFDRARGVAVLVGATSAFSPQLRVTVTYRSGRFGPALPGVPVPPRAGYVYDAARGEVLAFGGSGGGLFAVVDTMWRWNGAAWSEVAQGALRPPPRQGPALVFDPPRQRVVLFGGSDGVSNPLGDTWTWDGGAWQQITGPGPTPRERAGFAFDPQSSTCLLHGGYNRSNEIAGTWRWDGAAWTQLAVVNPPGAGELVETDDRPLLLRENLPDHNGTFRWNGPGFDQVAPPRNSLARYQTGFCYDVARDQLVLFGGQPVAGGLWLWNGTWRHVGLLQPGPAGRREHGMVYDSVRQQVVLFGGRAADVGGVPLGDTWTWDGSRWTEHVTGAAPPARIAPGFAFDAARGRAVLFGGTTFTELGDTWLWDGATWTQAQPTVAPARRWNPGMAYDALRQRVVLLNGMVGGSTVLDTWEWNGFDWQQRHPLAQPAGTIGWHGGRGQVVVSTGFGALHAWDGAEWRPVPVHAPPEARPSPLALVWHDRLQRLVLHAAGPGAQTLWALTETPPRHEVFAAACPAGGTNDCDLLAWGLPHLGNERLEVDLRGAAGHAPGAVLWGLAPGHFPVGGACAVLVDQAILGELAFTNAAGYGRLRTPVPDLPALLGVAVYLQGFVLDGRGPIGGASASDGLRLQLGR